MALSQVILDIYDYKFKLELDDFLAHLINMLEGIEKNFEKQNKDIKDPGVTRRGRVPDVHLDRSIRRQRLIRYMSWIRNSHVQKQWSDEKQMYVITKDRECYLDHMLCLALEARDTYICYLPNLEKQKEERILKDYRDRLVLMDKRRSAPLHEMIPALMRKIHFVSIMTQHENQEIHDLQLSQRISMLEQELEHKREQHKQRDRSISDGALHGVRKELDQLKLRFKKLREKYK